ncbi:hypothetical protein AArcSl_1541 [Halalkaliarchaeum desulfuricum]|uniref:Uncharacterized protein n=1 Tax=Halalkaliarchaeum desulfuricum TaxID=2055893 RepID=A0A343TJ98_9EURY|nr:hypothetical protein AArcSl_1541 [Halalkaliarchaeum desulfuricum]
MSCVCKLISESPACSNAERADTEGNCELLAELRSGFGTARVFPPGTRDGSRIPTRDAGRLAEGITVW